MKKTIKRIGALVVCFSFSLVGCNDYLEVEPLFSQDAENYFTNKDEFNLALTGAYDLMQGSFMNIWIGEIASDNSIAGGESVSDSKGLHDIDAMIHGGVNVELRNIFRWNYAGVTRANYLLENRDNIDFEGKSQVIAETRFLRAYYYFQLVKFFGDVPLIVDERIGTDEVKDIDRAPKSQVYSQIETDLISAAADLPWNVGVKGRADKGAALSLLGKVYLYQNKFTESASNLELVINSGRYSLLPDYRTLFLVANEGHSESVFDIQYSGLEGGGYDCFICLEGNAAPGFHGIRQYNGPLYGDGNSYNLPTQDLYDAFGVNDTIRRDASVLDIDAFIAKQSNSVNISYAIGGGGHTGFYNNKYIRKLSETGLPDFDLTSPVNYAVIRYADVLLMAAEANARNGAEGIALTYLNRVRSRVSLAGKTSGGQQLLEDIWNERRLELSGEGLRFFDLVRTGKAASEILGFATGKNELFPIPQVEIDLVGGNWSQNSGY